MSSTPTPDPAQHHLLSALNDATGAAAKIQATDLDRPTPCAEWTLGALLGHIGGQWRGFAAALRDGDAPAERYAPIPFNQTDFAAARDELVEAVRLLDPASAVRIADFGPDPIPAAGAVSAQLLDTAVHTWDVATALGNDYRPEPEVVTSVRNIAAGIPEAASAGPDAPFAAPVDSADATDPWEWALARVGRQTPSRA
ncbi:TIGR03086 family metal-binding protein [Nakamurella aerolata]|uniref:TIGR03086 family protein n=1 Tax=Nakamurella aerolata TaxID=1656892 RepID=A0A849AEG9_9ACTN|nr:TIGR03086 family metal-binding protein [Nakamurella aerolata]NNG35252.1 TIGR03086 family protein [Nakamurella aerolata]